MTDSDVLRCMIFAARLIMAALVDLGEVDIRAFDDQVDVVAAQLGDDWATWRMVVVALSVMAANGISGLTSREDAIASTERLIAGYLDDQRY